jgi:plastocyanin domain-containing protein
MKLSKSTSKTQNSSRNNGKGVAIFLLISVLVIGGLIGAMVYFVGQNNKDGSTETVVSENRQVVNMTAKDGFSPNKITAKAGVPMTLNVKTENTIDCTSVVNIPKLGINRSLPTTGNTAIEIPAQTAGTALNITCSMGMYNAEIYFN